MGGIPGPSECGDAENEAKVLPSKDLLSAGPSACCSQALQPQASLHCPPRRGRRYLCGDTTSPKEKAPRQPPVPQGQGQHPPPPPPWHTRQPTFLPRAHGHRPGDWLFIRTSIQAPPDGRKASNVTGSDQKPTNRDKQKGAK